MRTGPANGVNDIFYARTANQGCRTFIDSLVPELARLVIGIVLRENEIAGETRGEISEINAKACICSCHVLPFFLLFVLFCFPLVTIIRSGEDWLLTKLALFSLNFRYSSTDLKHQMCVGPGVG